MNAGGSKMGSMTAESLPENLVWTPREAAQLLGISERSVQRLCASGQIEAVRVGRQWRIGRNYLLRLMGMGSSHGPF